MPVPHCDKNKLHDSANHNALREPLPNADCHGVEVRFGSTSEHISVNEASSQRYLVGRIQRCNSNAIQRRRSTTIRRYFGKVRALTYKLLKSNEKMNARKTMHNTKYRSSPSSFPAGGDPGEITIVVPDLNHSDPSRRGSDVPSIHSK
jgi:hypothetical protein